MCVWLQSPNNQRIKFHTKGIQVRIFLWIQVRTKGMAPWTRSVQEMQQLWPEMDQAQSPLLTPLMLLLHHLHHPPQPFLLAKKLHLKSQMEETNHKQMHRNGHHKLNQEFTYYVLHIPVACRNWFELCNLSMANRKIGKICSYFEMKLQSTL